MPKGSPENLPELDPKIRETISKEIRELRKYPAILSVGIQPLTDQHFPKPTPPHPIVMSEADKSSVGLFSSSSAEASGSDLISRARAASPGAAVKNAVSFNLIADRAGLAGGLEARQGSSENVAAAGSPSSGSTGADGSLASKRASSRVKTRSSLGVKGATPSGKLIKKAASVKRTAESLADSGKKVRGPSGPAAEEDSASEAEEQFQESGDFPAPSELFHASIANSGASSGRRINTARQENAGVAQLGGAPGNYGGAGGAPGNYGGAGGAPGSFGWFGGAPANYGWTGGAPANFSGAGVSGGARAQQQAAAPLPGPAGGLAAAEPAEAAKVFSGDHIPAGHQTH